MMRLVYAILLAHLLVGGAAAADEPLSEIAPVVPKALEPYADAEKTLANAQEVVEFLATARFGPWIIEYEHEGKIRRVDFSLKGKCNTPELQSYYRGIHLSFAFYYLFLAKQEVGWFEYKSPIGDFDQSNRKFTGYGRGVLVQLWKPERLADLKQLLLKVRLLPSDLRSDLSFFLRMLREHRERVANLVARSKQELQELLERETSGYFYNSLWEDKYDADGKDATPESEKGLTYEGLSRELHKLINATRDHGEARISECLISEQPYRLELGDGPQIVSEKIFTPIKYMTTFWLRRRAEGTELLADGVLVLTIEALAD